MQIQSFVPDFLDYLSLHKKYSNHTITAYKNDILTFCNSLDSKTKEVTKNDIRAYIIYLSENKFQPKSIRRKISSIRSYFKYLIKSGKMKANPCAGVILPKLKSRIPEFVQTDNLKEYFQQQHGFNNLIETRNTLIIDLFYQSGMRRSELTHLTWKNIDFQNMHIKVLGKGNKERLIPFSDLLKKSLKNYLHLLEATNIKHQFIFVDKTGKPLSSYQIYYIVKNEMLKFSTQSKKSPHILRHTFATHLLNEGADINAIKNLLGHSNLQATQIYAHNNIEQLKKIYKQSHPHSGDHH